MNLRFQKTTGQLEKTSEIKKNKKKIAQLLTQINQYKESKDIRSIILTGVGENAFIAGADIRAMSQMNSKEA